MRLGVLDVGSNTVHLLVVDAHPGGRPTPEVTHKSVLRLMRFLTPDGAINQNGIETLITAISDAAEVATREGVDDLLPMATSALREAINGPMVLEQIEQRTGVRLQVLDGEDEARLTFLAVRRWFGWSAGEILLFDIGGGSLEIAAGSDEYPDVSVSVPLGAGRSTLKFLHDDPPTAGQVDALRDHAAAVLSDARRLFTARPAPDHVVGSSKTIRSLAKLAGYTAPTGYMTQDGSGDSLRLRRSGLKDWEPRLTQLPASARQSLPGITPDRAFQITGGAIVLRQAMKAFEVRELEVSPWALREGMLLRYLDAL